MESEVSNSIKKNERKSDINELSKGINSATNRDS